CGLYNKVPSKVSGRTIYNEDFVCCPDWTFTTFKINNGEWFNPEEGGIRSLEKQLDFRNGILYREMEVEDQEKRVTRIKSIRFISMKMPNAGALRYTVTPVNYSGTITIRSGLKGDIINSGVERYSQLNQHHLERVEESSENNTTLLLVRTTESKRLIAQGALHRVMTGNKEITPEWIYSTDERYCETGCSLKTEKGQDVTLEKRCIIDADPLEGNTIEKNDIITQRDSLPSFDKMKLDSIAEWNRIWERADIEVAGDDETERISRLHTYHLCVTASFNTIGRDVSVPARGLHGEAYRGHIFWDEIYVMPFYMRNFPEIARSLIMYRVNRLEPAKEYAAEYGYKGAMFPWQSGSKGTEETQTMHLNPNSGEWGPDFSSLQRHISIAVAYNIWNYFHYTNDLEFLEKHGLEVLLEIGRFWISKTEYSNDKGRYVINKVMGPNEFHEKYPDNEEGGVNNNAYTNIMVSWLLDRCFEALDMVSSGASERVWSSIDLNEDELGKWKKIQKEMYIPILENGIIDQYEGFCRLKEITSQQYDEYRKKYGSIQRMDRILKAEGLSPDEYQVSKQADLLMVFYLLPVDSVKDIFSRCGYELTDEMIHKNYEYYLNRTSHGSTLSFIVHSYLALLFNDRKRSDEWFKTSLTADVKDVQGGTVKEGIHTGLMAGTIELVISAFAGLELSGTIPSFIPKLRNEWEKLAFSFMFREINYHVVIAPKSLKIKPESDDSSLVITVNGKEYSLSGNQWREISL
ncbi:MAG: glycoside hydrolase family 65 protein, partial [Chitinivibrionales bacterium]